LYLASWEAEMEIIQLSRSSTLWLSLTSASIQGNLGLRLFSYGPTRWGDVIQAEQARLKSFLKYHPNH
jgi:hypothetical protein